MAIRKGLLEFGPANETAVLFEDLMDSKALSLTANTTGVYMMAWLEMGDEPMVIETPPDVLGFVNDHWFKYVTDCGRLGPDEGKGGKLETSRLRVRFLKCPGWKAQLTTSSSS